MFRVVIKLLNEEGSVVIFMPADRISHLIDQIEENYGKEANDFDVQLIERLGGNKNEN